MRVIVCGSRSWTDGLGLTIAMDLLRSELGFMRKEITEVIHGDCRGPDKWAGAWAERNGIDTAEMPADWDKHGRRAGMLRNQAMADRGADLCIAFWDGESKGTAHMIACATKAGIPVRIVPPFPPPRVGGE